MTAIGSVLSAGCFLVAGAYICVGLYLLGQMLIESIRDRLERRRQRRIARIEAELDEKQERLRQAIFSLATQLAAERDEASRQMTRQARLSAEKTPPTS
ncbi:hypothetical protein [Leucobacter tenebrionis]|uniref:hypothetical protein n=1 Tax=Leucobacter tenebrionis TaxID=2873270 RepID=UPI001CA60DA1|nr:hypothetical protein [Leucobacter tenebrionis]QZY52865.1 hypothetical protein KVY00_05360 [Leucobacter tenebrionis]